MRRVMWIRLYGGHVGLAKHIERRSHLGENGIERDGKWQRAQATVTWVLSWKTDDQVRGVLPFVHPRE